MKKLTQIVLDTRNFFGDVMAELRKSSWPTRPELLDSTVVVILSVVALAIFVGFSDLILMKFLEMVL
ncbi:MAG: preprotein translocase subunit SecE [Lentisphaerae bacterium]|nr:preprotein translocase subunit SecE [Lentisphaerota bacterium]